MFFQKNLKNRTSKCWPSFWLESKAPPSSSPPKKSPNSGRPTVASFPYSSAGYLEPWIRVGPWGWRVLRFPTENGEIPMSYINGRSQKSCQTSKKGEGTRGFPNLFFCGSMFRFSVCLTHSWSWKCDDVPSTCRDPRFRIKLRHLDLDHDRCHVALTPG